MSYYRGKKVFITGGSSGIGRCMALQVAKAGGDVAIAARGQEKLDAVLAELNEASDGNHHAFSVDVSDAEAVRETAARVIEALGGIDVVVNCAGVAYAGYFEEVPHDQFEKMMNINFYGVVHVCRAFVPTLREQGHGHIHIVGSVLSYLAAFGYTPYSPSKYAASAFAEALRQELLADGVKVSVSYPPDTDTPQWHYENKHKPPETKMLNQWAGLKQPEEVADALLRGIAKGKLHILPDFWNKVIRWVHFTFPFIVRSVIAFDLWRFRRNNPARTSQTHEA